MASANSPRLHNPPAEAPAASFARLWRGESTLACADSVLLARFLASRDDSAFESLVLRHGPMVLATCKRILADSHAADDAFQSTFLTLALRARSIRHIPSLGPWLHRVASRIALRVRKQSARIRQREIPLLSDHDTPAQSPSLEQPPLLLDLDAELDRLPPKHRAPVILCYLQGHTHAEAARALDWPIGSVKGRLARARATLQKRLQSQCPHATSTPISLAAALQTCARSAKIPLPASAVARAVSLVQALPAHLNPLIAAPSAHLFPGVLTPMFWNKGLTLATACSLPLVLGSLLTLAVIQSSHNTVAPPADPLHAPRIPQSEHPAHPNPATALDGYYTLAELDAGPQWPAQRLMIELLKRPDAFRSAVIKNGLITLHATNEEHPPENPLAQLHFHYEFPPDQDDGITLFHLATPPKNKPLPGIIRRDPDRIVIIFDAAGQSRPAGIGIKLANALVRWTLVPQQVASEPDNPQTESAPIDKPRSSTTTPAAPMLAPIDPSEIEAAAAQLAQTQSSLDLTQLALENEKQRLAARSLRIAQLDEALETPENRSQEQLQILKEKLRGLEEKQQESLAHIMKLNAKIQDLRLSLSRKQADLDEKSRLAALGKPRKILPGDTLQIEVLEALPGRPITGPRQVKTDGTISLGFYGEIPVAGLTRHEIKINVIEQLRQYLNDEVLGLLDTDPQTGKSIAVSPADSDRVYVDELDAAPADPQAERILRLEAEIERLRALLNVRQSAAPGSAPARPPAR